MAIKRLSSSLKNSSFSGPVTPSVEYVIVGGGGGASGYYSSGGGGAGGYRSSVQGEMSGGGASAEAPYVITPGVTYYVTVGKGGRGCTGDDTTFFVENGGNSKFGNIISYGGGASGCNQAGAPAPNSGGSGGGQRMPNGSDSGGAGVSGQGYRGGNGNSNSYVDPYYAGTGGGGAGGTGVDGFSGSTATNGGIGVQSSITGTATYYAGGGAGGAQNGGTSAIGGLGGGGNAGDGSGTRSYPGSHGVPNTGGGGGAGNRSQGGNGGSGVVILRYKENYMPAITTGEVVETVVNGYRIYKFIGDGTICFGPYKNLATTYSRDNLFFDFDAADLSYTDGQTISNGTVLYHRDPSFLNLTTTNTLLYSTEAGGSLNYGAATGYARLLGSPTYQWAELNAAKSISLVCWFKSDQTSRQCLLSRFNTDDTVYSNPVYQFNHIVDPTGDYHWNSSGVISGAAGDLNTNSWSANTWTLSVWVYDVNSGTAKWYENNANLVSTQTPGGDNLNGLKVDSHANTPLGLGVRGDGYPEILKGKLAIARVYTKALSVNEIQSEYAAHKSRFGLS